MQRQSDAVVSHAVLREVVSADLLTAIAAADHGFALFGQGLLLFFHLHLIEAGPQHTHALFPGLGLGLFVLAAHHAICRQRRGADRRVGRVGPYPPRTTAPKTDLTP